MKILHIIFTMKTGGLENLLLDISNEQAARGHHVDVMIINSGSEPEMLRRFSSDVEIININRRGGSRNPLPLIRANWEIIKRQPDVIHVHNENGVNILLPSLRKKVIQTIHTTGINLRGCQRQTAVAAISEAVAADLKDNCGVVSTVVMNGIKVNEIPHRKLTDSLRSLVCVGRMDVSVKGQDLLLSALQRFPDLSLTLIGDGPDLNAMKELARTLKIQERVEFRGALPRDVVYELLPSFDAFVIPSRHEGFGLVAAEAMAAGLPIVSVNLPGPMEIIDGGRLGYCFESESVDSLADAIYQMKLNWQEAQQKALHEGIDFVNRHFSIEATVTQYLDLYSRHRPVNK